MTSWRGTWLRNGYVFMAWYLVKKWMTSWSDTWLRNGYVFMAWYLIKKWLSLHVVVLN